ncbi:MAG TPA: hypothetical protein VMU78_01240 [Methylocella sp.]|nr:hypothetical protein [Methylocella sp.]
MLKAVRAGFRLTELEQWADLSVAKIMGIINAKKAFAIEEAEL